MATIVKNCCTPLFLDFFKHQVTKSNKWNFNYPLGKPFEDKHAKIDVIQGIFSFCRIYNRLFKNNQIYLYRLLMDSDMDLILDMMPEDNVDVNCPCFTPPHDPSPQPVDATSTAGPTG